MLSIICVALWAIRQGARRAADPFQRSLLWSVFASGIGFLISMSGVNVFFQISLQVLFWGLVGLGLGVVTHVVGARSFVTVWRFGDERPRPAERRARAGRREPRLALDPSHQTGVAD